MEPDDDIILNAAMTVVVRYGMKRTTMADVAHEAGVSRQTIYDRYGDKDGMMAAAIGHFGRRLNIEFRAALDTVTDLATQIDAYYNVVIYPTYETIQKMPDAADLEKGLGHRSVAASHDAMFEKQAILKEMLQPHLPTTGPSAVDVAAFIEQASSKAKMSGMPREELDRFLSVLKSSVLAMAINN